MDFNLLMHIINGIVGAVAIIASLYLYKFHFSNFNLWPKNLRIFFLYFCFYVSTGLALTCVILTTIAVLTSNSRPPIYHFFRLLLTLFCQQLRFSYFFIIMERMFATLYLKEYAKFSTTFNFFGIYIILSIVVQILCNLTSFLIFFEVIPSILSGGYDNIIWTAFSMHTLTLISCKLLYDKNQKMYKLLAYQTTLQQRHQIVENIKVLSNLWPTIFVFSIVSPLGPASTFIFTLTTNNLGPIGLFHITYNFAPIIIALYSKYGSRQQKHEIFPTNSSIALKTKQLVKSPLGTILPTHVSQEKYFRDLKDQWN